MTSSTPQRPGFPWMVPVLGAGVLAALYLVFWKAQAPWQKLETGRWDYLGVDYKIFYFHVASAAAALSLFFACALVSAGFLALRRMSGLRALAARADRLAVAMAEVAVLFGLVVLVTGPIWAKPAWDTWWTWEPRLTLALLTELLFVGYLVLRSYAGRDETGRVLSAGVAVIGAPATWLTHVAVRMWGGNHPTVVTEGGGGLATPEMRAAFGVSLAAISLLALYLVHARYRTHALRDDLEDVFLDLSDLPDREEETG